MAILDQNCIAPFICILFNISSIYLPLHHTRFSTSRLTVKGLDVMGRAAVGHTLWGPSVLHWGRADPDCRCVLPSLVLSRPLRTGENKAWIHLTLSSYSHTSLSALRQVKLELVSAVSRCPLPPPPPPTPCPPETKQHSCHNAPLRFSEMIKCKVISLRIHF